MISSSQTAARGGERLQHITVNARLPSLMYFKGGVQARMGLTPQTSYVFSQFHKGAVQLIRIPEDPKSHAIQRPDCKKELHLYGQRQEELGVKVRESEWGLWTQ